MKIKIIKAIYIPQFENEKEAWGNNTRTKRDISERNFEIKQKKPVERRYMS